MFEAQTGMLLWSLETSTLAALLAVLWLHAPSKKHHLFFACGFAAVGIGSALVSQRGYLADFWTIIVGNTLALSAFGFWLAGLLRLERRKIEGWIFIPPLLWLAFMFLPPVRDSMLARVLVYHLCAAIGYCTIAGVVLTSKEPLSTTRKIFAAALVVHALIGPLTAALIIPYNMLVGQRLPLTAPVAYSAAFSFVVLMMIAVKMFMEDNERRLHRLSVTDHLTGVLNRRGLMEAFPRIKKAPEHRSSQLMLALFDIDHFKKINDRHGHQCGDDVLVQFCALVDRIVGVKGTFVRMGGEEFAYLLTHIDLNAALRIVDGVRVYFARLSTEGIGGSFSSTVSIGIYSAPVVEADLDLMLKMADRALYAAKSAGRNRTVFNDGVANVVLPADDRGEDPHDNNADRQVAALNRIAAIGSA
ncbi:GGDEF domain-containing protein [Agrobacterium sp. SORGH_AS 787]|uniref:GGDEF domain-containing protein n=1 Tax=Agrobacterium sp. SORGH_AS 787 TaxID=3041775 RepID=UPI002789A6B7|nr:diguanylate cyclase (GGDEF)-like protein [Rhizobium sp. SORGH_AS_0787]